MRGLGKIFLVATLALPAGWLVATPASAATIATCKSVSGTGTFTPPLPVTSAKVLAILKASGTAKTCTGKGGASMTFTFTGNKPKAPGLNCKSLLAATTTPKLEGTGTMVIKWVNKKATTETISLYTVPGKPLNATIKGKYKSGTLKGSLLTEVTFTPTKGNCGSKALAAIKFTQAKGKTLTLK